jgi:hypothetical protein
VDSERFAMTFRHALTGALLSLGLCVAACAHGGPSGSMPPRNLVADTIMCMLPPCNREITRAVNLGETASPIRAEPLDDAPVIGSAVAGEEVTLIVSRDIFLPQRGVVKTAGDGLAAGDVVWRYAGGVNPDLHPVRQAFSDDDNGCSEDNFDEEKCTAFRATDLPPNFYFVVRRGETIKVGFEQIGGPTIRWAPDDREGADPESRRWYQVRTDQGVTGWTSGPFCILAHMKQC